MARSKITEEERIVAWFQNADINCVAVLLNIIRGIMRDRDGSVRALLTGPSERDVIKL